MWWIPFRSGRNGRNISYRCVKRNGNTLGLNFAPFRPVTGVPVNSGQFRPKFIFWPVWISELERHLFARSPKILLSLSSVSHFCTCSSLSLYHLSLSDPLNRDREVDNKIEEQDEAKMVWLEKQKRRRRRWDEEKIAQKVKWWRKTSNNEEVQFEQLIVL